MRIRVINTILTFLTVITITMMVSSCARMGAPDGGWYDERPPRVVSASPEDKGVNASQKKIRINFDEFIKIDNVQEKVVISPPQKEQPEIKAHGRYIQVTLLDSLLPGTTYTVDFSDAISDNNEGNPMGSYTYSFSTGEEIDTLEVSGYVLNAEDLEPVKGVLVGLYPYNADSTQVEKAEKTLNDSLPPFVRVSRSDSRGHFVIRGVKQGRYTVGALQDVDGDYRFTQRGEVMAFSHNVITPSFFQDQRRDTVWADAIHVKDILFTPYTHFTPDDIVLRSFAHTVTDRYYLKFDRTQADHFTLYFTAPAPDNALPEIKGLNFDSTDAFVIEPTAKADTVTYWLRDTALVNKDTLQMVMTTMITDTLGVMQLTSDTLEIMAKTPYARRLKADQKAYDEWKTDIEKRLKRKEKWAREHPDDPEGEAIDTIPPRKQLQVKYDVAQSMTPDGSIFIEFPAPMTRIDSSAIHLYVEQDSLWYRAPYTFQKTDKPRRYEIYSEWIPGAEYSFEVDTLAFEDIYGITSVPYKTGFRVATMDAFSSLFVEVVANTTSPILVQMLNNSGKPVREQYVENGTAQFYYVKPGDYYLRAIIDRNDNGKWDTGDYYLDEQPEEVYYNPEPIECKAKWDMTRHWNLTELPLYQQKPESLIKQKADKERVIQHRNAQRSAEKGKPIPQKWQ